MFFLIEGEQPREVWRPLKDAAGASETRKVEMIDPEVRDLVASGTAGVGRPTEKEPTVKKRAETAKEAAKGDSVGVRRVRGG
jgi:hypothetical protein